jgi:GT2 family glycosyltransferase
LVDVASHAVGIWLAGDLREASDIDPRASETVDLGPDQWLLCRRQGLLGIAELIHSETKAARGTNERYQNEAGADVSLGSGAEAEVAPMVSVVVCTLNRAEDLRRCLDHLHRCDPPADEIIVVDNGSQSSETRDVVVEFATVRYVLESRIGLDIARNTGAQAASGNILAYVDDDVRVYPQWVSSVQQAFEDDSVMALTGPVLPRQLETRAQWIFESEWGFNRGYRRRDFGPEFLRQHRVSGAPVWEVGAGANMAFRREVFDRIGYFDVRLDVGAAGCSGDSEYWYRVMAAGLKCRYDPSVVVEHRHRESMEGLERQLSAYMRGHTAALLVQFERHRHWGNLVRLGFWLPLYYLKRIVRRVVFGPGDSFVPIRQEMLGCVSGVLFYLRSISLDRRKWSTARRRSVPSPQGSAAGVPKVTPPIRR